MIRDFFNLIRRSNPNEAERTQHGLAALTKYSDELRDSFLKKFGDGGNFTQAQHEYEVAKRIDKLSSPAFGIAHSFFMNHGLTLRWDHRPTGRVEKEQAQRAREKSISKLNEIIARLNSYQAALKPANNTEQSAVGALRIEELTSKELLSDSNYTNFQVVDDYLSKIEAVVKVEAQKQEPVVNDVAKGQMVPLSANIEHRAKLINSMDVDLRFWKALLTEINLGSEKDWYGGIQRKIYDIHLALDKIVTAPYERRISPIGIAESDQIFVAMVSGEWLDWEGTKKILADDFQNFADPQGYLGLLGISQTDIHRKTVSEIETIFKTKFRDAVKKYHPDVNPGNMEAENAMKKLSNFKDIMSSPDKLRMYLKS